jgi:hypothetical protein
MGLMMKKIILKIDKTTFDRIKAILSNTHHDSVESLIIELVKEEYSSLRRKRGFI